MVPQARAHAAQAMGAVRRPVIDAVTCQDITVGHMQQIVNAAPTPGEGDRVQGMISADRERGRR